MRLSCHSHFVRLFAVGFPTFVSRRHARGKSAPVHPRSVVTFQRPNHGRESAERAKPLPLCIACNRLAADRRGCGTNRRQAGGRCESPLGLPIDAAFIPYPLVVAAIGALSQVGPFLGVPDAAGAGLPGAGFSHCSPPSAASNQPGRYHGCPEVRLSTTSAWCGPPPTLRPLPGRFWQSGRCGS